METAIFDPKLLIVKNVWCTLGHGPACEGDESHIYRYKSALKLWMHSDKTPKIDPEDWRCGAIRYRDSE